jgi:hypothetical protein
MIRNGVRYVKHCGEYVPASRVRAMRNRANFRAAEQEAARQSVRVDLHAAFPHGFGRLTGAEVREVVADCARLEGLTVSLVGHATIEPAPAPAAAVEADDTDTASGDVYRMRGIWADDGGPAIED